MAQFTRPTGRKRIFEDADPMHLFSEVYHHNLVSEPVCITITDADGAVMLNATFDDGCTFTGAFAQPVDAANILYQMGGLTLPNVADYLDTNFRYCSATRTIESHFIAK